MLRPPTWVLRSLFGLYTMFGSICILCFFSIAEFTRAGQNSGNKRMGPKENNRLQTRTGDFTNKGPSPRNDALGYARLEKEPTATAGAAISYDVRRQSSTRGIAQATSSKESPSTKTSDKVTHNTNGIKRESADLVESRSMVRIEKFEEHPLDSTFTCSTSVTKMCSWEALNATRLRKKKSTISTNSLSFLCVGTVESTKHSVCSRLQRFKADYEKRGKVRRFFPLMRRLETHPNLCA